jgi:hypothetical protein
MGARRGQAAEAPGQPPEPAKRKCRGLKGIAERAAGLCE